MEDKKKINFYMDECVKSNWSTRQLEREINKEREILEIERGLKDDK